MKKLVFVLNLVLILSHCCFATVSSGETIREPFACNGSTTTFTFTFKCNSSDDVFVYKQLISTGVESSLVVDTDYTIAPTSSSYLNGGVVTIDPALASTYNVKIVRKIKLSQETASGAITPTSIVAALDKLTRQVQDAEDRKKRSIHLQESDSTSFDMVLPALTEGYVAINDSNSVIIATAVPEDTVVVSSYMETILDDANLTEVTATLGLSEGNANLDINSIASVTGTFSGAVSGTTGTFSGAVAGTTGTFSGAVAGTTGTFSGAVSGTTGVFTEKLDVAGNIDPTTYETTNGGFLDEDNMASDSAVATASQQSVKKYVDDQIAPLDIRIKGWVRFDGTGTLSVKDSSNVTSVTDNGTGLYTINWDTNFANVNYCVVGSCHIAAQAVSLVRLISISVGSCQIQTNNGSGALDADIVCVMAIGDQ